MQARKEFNDHGLGDIIQLEHRDVCKDGFGLKDAVNAGKLLMEVIKRMRWMIYISMLVFLDLPAPWEAVASAKETFIQHRTGKICCFSPCIEQVAKTVEALNSNGFVGKDLNIEGVYMCVTLTRLSFVRYYNVRMPCSQL